MGKNAINQNAEHYIHKLVEEFGAELEPIVKQTYNSAVSELEKKASIKSLYPWLHITMQEIFCMKTIFH